jgi:hypothetical protein
MSKNHFSNPWNRPRRISRLRLFQTTIFPSLGKYIPVAARDFQWLELLVSVFPNLGIFERITGTAGFETETFLFPNPWDPVILSK